MFAIFLGFLPWIAYFLLSGDSRSSHLLAMSIALLMMVVLDRKALKKGFILVWGGTVFFSSLLIISLCTSTLWFSANAGLLGNIALMLITWFSLIIGKPFTLQYAREETDPKAWDSPLFWHINIVLTGVWGLSFTLLTSMSLLRRYFDIPDNMLYQTLTYLPSILAIIFTKHFPTYSQKQFREKCIQGARNKLSTSPFLKGNFAPVHQEIYRENLEVHGSLPNDLQGIYMRNGPNPQFPPFSYTYPFDGDGMVHALYFTDKGVHYRNRFILTDQLATERRFGKALYGGISAPVIRDEDKLRANDPQMPVKLGRFIHIIQHAGQYLALHESTFAYEISRDLETIGPWNPTHAATPVDVNAHSRLDPNTGERFFIAYSLDATLNYLVLDKEGKPTQEGIVPLDRTYMIHDFVLTSAHMVVFLCPAILNLYSPKGTLSWDSQSPTNILIWDRKDLNKPAEIITTDAFFTFHFANAHEEEGKIIIEHVRYERFPIEITADLCPSLYQSTIHLKNKTCTHQRLDDRKVEFPRINETFDTQAYRFIYACLQTNSKTLVMQAIIKYDLLSNSSEIHDFGSHAEIGEPIFVSRNAPKSEDDGYLLLYVYDERLETSRCVILDAKNITKEPLASIILPQRVPHGLHGSWMAENQ